MSSPHNRPKWWQVYLTLPLLVLLFITENRLRLSVGGHQVIQIGIVLLIYILIHLWLKANSGALSNVDRGHPSRAFRVYQIPPAPLSGSGNKEQSTIRIYGVLGTTFEMDHIDAEHIEAGEVLQELKKE